MRQVRIGTVMLWVVIVALVLTLVIQERGHNRREAELLLEVQLLQAREDLVDRLTLISQSRAQSAQADTSKPLPRQ